MSNRIQFYVFYFLLGLLSGYLVYELVSEIKNNECEKELLRRDEPKGIVCLTEIQSIVTSNGDVQ